MCPYCGEPFILLVDPSVEKQSYIEDCEICCRPIIVNVQVFDEDTISIDLKQEDE